MTATKAGLWTAAECFAEVLPKGQGVDEKRAMVAALLLAEVVADIRTMGAILKGLAGG